MTWLDLAIAVSVMLGAPAVIVGALNWRASHESPPMPDHSDFAPEVEFDPAYNPTPET